MSGTGGSPTIFWNNPRIKGNTSGGIHESILRDICGRNFIFLALNPNEENEFTMLYRVALSGQDLNPEKLWVVG